MAHVCKHCAHHHHHHKRSVSTEHSLSDSNESPASVATISSETTRMGLDPGFLSHPKHKGEVFNVAIARSYNGPDAGEICVAKWVRSSHQATCKTKDHVRPVRLIAKVASDIIHDFTESCEIGDWMITINDPRLMKCQSQGKHSGKVVLVEPYISKFKKFNSNTGWVRPSQRTYNKILQALSHHSYIYSSGQFVLCDLQGGVDHDEKVIKLTDAAIVTREGNKFGCADIGNRGIQNFFNFHTCSEFCHELPTPKKNKIFFAPIEATRTNK